MLSNSIKSMLVLTIIFTVSACSIAGGNDELWPLTIGSYWIYEIETHMGDAPVLNSLDTTTIEKKITWGGHTWYGEEYDEGGDYHRDAKEGLYNLSINAEYPDGKAELIIEYPIKIGNSQTEADSTTIIIEAIDETVTVPAGKFDGCYLCKMTMPGGMTGSMWMKPGIGMVKMQLKAKQGDMDIRSVQNLKEYHLK